MSHDQRTQTGMNNTFQSWRIPRQNDFVGLACGN
jgi:hypothetical protein